MAAIKITTCPLCKTVNNVDETVVVSYEKPDQYEIAVGVTEEEYWRKWVRCKYCSLIFSIYSRRVDAFDLLYEDLYRKPGAVPWRKLSVESTFDLVLALPPEKSETMHRVTYIKNKIEVLKKVNLFPHIKEHRLLDVGGATGSFAHSFLDHEWKSYVMDPSPDGVFIEKYGVQYKEGYFTSDSYYFKFDLISLVFVLEHVLEPADLLTEIRKSLPSHGLLYIEVPDEIAFEKVAQEDDIFNSCHLFMFGPRSIHLLLSQLGFELMSLDRTRTVRGHFALICLARPKIS